MKSRNLSSHFTVYLFVIINFLTVSVHAQKHAQVHVPDYAFRSILSDNYAITFSADNKITNPEVAANLLDLSLSGEISNLEGIEAFTSLQSLHICCSRLDSLNLTANTNLLTLNVAGSSEHELTSLNVSANKKLTSLYCHYNKLTALDLSANTDLRVLDVSGNQLTSLNLSANKYLTSLNCDYNQLTTLNLSENTTLTSLICSNNQLKNLNLSTNLGLTFLQCDYNQLLALDLSTNKALTSLYCRNNQLSTLDLTTNTLLNSLGCSDNRLTRIYLAHDAVLSQFDCLNNRLTHLDFWDMKMPHSSYYKRQSQIYSGNNFPFYYNNLFPLIKNQIRPLLYKLSFFLIYLTFILFLLFQKHEDSKRNKRLNVWIIVANCILIPVWVYYFSWEKERGMGGLVLLFFGIPIILTGIFMQLVPLITKIGAVGRQKGTLKLIGLIIVMVYLFYRFGGAITDLLNAL